MRQSATSSTLWKKYHQVILTNPVYTNQLINKIYLMDGQYKYRQKEIIVTHLLCWYIAVLLPKVMDRFHYQP